MNMPFYYQELEQVYSSTIGKGLRTLTVTSCISGQGTSSMVCALAQRAKSVGYKVLVVDLNLHNPDLTRMLIDNNPMPNHDIHQYWDPQQQRSPQTMVLSDGHGLAVIPAPIKPDLTDPLQTETTSGMYYREENRLKALIDVWLGHHDILLFDTSPLCLVNKHNIPAQMVATCCEGTLLMVQSGTTQSSELVDAMAILNTRNINLIGVVVNDYKNPLLADELLRQCHKLNNHMPKLAHFLINKISTNRFLHRQF